MSRLRHLWRNVFHRGRVDAEIDAELRATLDLIEEDGRAAGLTPDAARRAAVLSLGRPEPRILTWPRISARRWRASTAA